MYFILPNVTATVKFIHQIALKYITEQIYVNKGTYNGVI